MKIEQLKSLSYEVGVLMVIADATCNESLVECTNAILNSIGKENIQSDELTEGAKAELMNRYPEAVSSPDIMSLFMEELMMVFGFEDEEDEDFAV